MRKLSLKSLTLLILTLPQVTQGQTVVSANLDGYVLPDFITTKTYDASTLISEEQIGQFSNETLPTLNGIAEGHNVYLTASGFYADANGNATKNTYEVTNVVVTWALAGSDANLYQLDPNTSTTSEAATITKLNKSFFHELEDQEHAGNWFPEEYLRKEYDGTYKVLIPDGGIPFTPVNNDIFLPGDEEEMTLYDGEFSSYKPTTATHVSLHIKLPDNSNYTLDNKNRATIDYCSCGIIDYITLHVVQTNTEWEYGLTLSKAGYNYYRKDGTLVSKSNIGCKVTDQNGNIYTPFINIIPVGNYTLTWELTKTSMTANSTYMADVSKSQTTCQVLPRTLSLSDPTTFSIADRVYDGTTTLGTITPPTLDLSNIVGSDTVSLIYTPDLSQVKAEPGTYTVFFDLKLTNPSYRLDTTTIAAQSRYAASFTILPNPNVFSPSQISGTELTTTKVYDGKTSLIVPTEGIAIEADPRAKIIKARCDGSDAGTHDVTVTIQLSDGLTFADGSTEAELPYPTLATIKPRTLMWATKIEAEDKIYDGTTEVTVSAEATLGNMLPDDIDKLYVTRTNSVVMADSPDEGIQIIRGYYELYGESAHNYVLPDEGLCMGQVLIFSRKALTISFSEIPTLTYGHSTLSLDLSADVYVYTIPAADGILSIDGIAGLTLPVGYDQTYTLRFTPLDTVHYMVSTADVTVTVLPKTITTSGTLTLATHTYDGQTTVTDTWVSQWPELEGLEPNDQVTLTVSGNIESPNVGSRTATLTLSLEGGQAQNYVLSSEATNIETTCLVTQRRIEALVSEDLPTSKVYDGTTQIDLATVPKPQLNDLVASDANLIWATCLSAQTNDRNVGEQMATFRWVIEGDTEALNNYNILMPAATTTPFVISARQLTVSDPIFSSTNKIYDGTTSAPEMTTLPELTNAVEDDDITLITSAAYDFPAVGPRTITVSFNIQGADKDNYITPEPITLDGTIENFDYQGNDNLTVSYTNSQANVLCSTNQALLKAEIEGLTPSTFSITFDNVGKENGFVDLADQPWPTSGNEAEIALSLPTEANTYSSQYIVTGQLTATDASGLQTNPLPFSIELGLTSDLLHFKFGNTVLVDNSDNLFTSYQWLFNDSPIEEATKQYYYNLNLPKGWYAVSTLLTDGTTRTICPLEFSGSAESTKLNLKTLSSTNGMLTIAIGMATDEEGILNIYNLSGTPLVSNTPCHNNSMQTISLPQGLYIVSIETASEALHRMISIK